MPKEINLILATDLHYISPRLTDNGAAFTTLIENSDGKTMRYIEPITDAFLEEVTEIHPDALILSGDLTFNGAVQSHEDLCKKLKTVQENGIPIFVIPGNHDISNPSAARFIDDSYELVSSADREEFLNLYGEFGYERARSIDPESGSYVVDLTKSLRILMLDTNSPGINALSNKTVNWVEEQLKQAEQDGAKIISVSHQNLLLHSELFTFGYIVENTDKLCKLYKKYGVLCNLAGHMHIQHIAEGEMGVTEILTSALSVSPHQYGEITITEDDLRYSVTALDLNNWSGLSSSTDDILHHFAEYSQDFFDRTTSAKLQASWTEEASEESLKAGILSAYRDINAAYFSGRTLDSKSVSSLPWEEYTGGFTAFYIRGVLREFEEHKNHRSWKVSF